MSTLPKPPRWIAADWGTSNLRVRAIGADGDILAEAASDDGMGSLTPDAFEPALLRLIGPWLGAGVTPVLAAGMVGARQGWIEAPYRRVPCAPLAGEGLIRAPSRDPRTAVFIAPGLSQQRPADVMRGEETQIAGALAVRPGFDGVFCLPGTHSKWVHVSAGEVVSFQTYMTGEVFALLSRQSVLRFSMTEDATEDAAAFDEALSDALSRPERAASRLFSIRAESLLSGLTPAAAKGRLSGLLIGVELAGARPYWLGQPVILIGSSGLCAAYARALAQQGNTAEILPAADCTLAGLSTLVAGVLP
jgi:2-dehydro-3-deoxygalactonokinase